MAKKKIKFELKQDVLAMCNNRIRKRLFKIPIGVKPKEYFFTGKVDIEVENPEWDKKAIERSLMLNIKRSMQILSVRANTLLENLDKEKPADFKEELKLIDKLKKTLKMYGKEVADQAEYNLGQIIDDITKDVAKWGKAGDALNAMKTVDNGKKSLKKSVGTLEDSLVAVAVKIKEQIEKTESKDRMKRKKEYEKKLITIERGNRDQLNDYEFKKRRFEQDYEELDKDRDKAISSDVKGKERKEKEREFEKSRKVIERSEEDYNRQQERIRMTAGRATKEEMGKYNDDLEKIKEATVENVKGFSKEAVSAFATYRKERGDFNKILKDTAKKMHKMVDSKSKENKAIAELQDMLKKKIKPAADTYGKDLEKCDKKIMAVITRLQENRVSKDDINKAMPDKDLGSNLFAAFDKVKKHMKAEKIQ